VSLGVGGVLQVLGGCTRAHPLDVAPTRELLFVIVAVVALAVSLKRLLPSWRPERSNGREHLDQRDGRDSAIMTVCVLCASVLRKDQGVT
jgi:hypothetical protein